MVNYKVYITAVILLIKNNSHSATNRTQAHNIKSNAGMDMKFVLCEDTQDHVVKIVTRQTAQVLKTLTDLWGEGFNKRLCEQSAEAFTKHVEIFYNDIVDETKGRLAIIKSDVQRLTAELDELKTTLSFEIKLKHDIPLYSHRGYLTATVTVLKEELRKRKIQIDGFLEEQKALCDELGENPKQLDNGPILPTLQDLTEFRSYLDQLAVLKQTRQNEFYALHNQIDDLTLKLKASLDDFGNVEMLKTPYPLSKEKLAALENIRNTLKERYNWMQKDISKMEDKLGSLWELYKMQDKNSAKPFEGDIFERERRYTDWRRKLITNISSIAAIRQELSSWWAKAMCTDSEQCKFKSFTSDTPTDEILAAHQMELKRLKEFYFANENLFRLLKEGKPLWQRLKVLNGEESTDLVHINNSNEETERETISKIVFDIESEILKLAETYQKKTNKIFTVYGMPVTEYMAREKKRFDLIKL